METFKKYLQIGIVAVLIVAAVLTWYAVFFAEHHKHLLVNFFDVGQGDSIFIETPSGNQILIDGGPSDAVLGKLGEVMPFWDRSIDMLVLTHAHADHVTGLISVLARYHVDQALESGEAYGTPEYHEWHDRLNRQHIPITTARYGQTINLGGGVWLRVLSPFEDYKNVSVKNPHDANVSAKLEYGSTSVLLMGDAEKPIEYRLVSEHANEIVSDVLKIGHHGSKTSSTEQFLDAVRPHTAVISVGRRNRYGHPHQDVLGRLITRGVKVFRTDVDGDIVFESDGMGFIMNHAVAQ